MLEKIQRRNYAGFLIHALFLALTMNFIDVNTVVPSMIGELGGTAFHLGLLSAIMVGGTSFMQLVFAGFITHLPRKKPALLVGIYLRVSALMILGFFLLRLGNQADWKIWAVILLMTTFSFSGAFANISYTDLMGRSVPPARRKKLLMNKQLISSIGIIVSSLIVKVILSSYSYPVNYSYLFIIGASLLLLATAGFWIIREPVKETQQVAERKRSLALFASALKSDKNLRYYLLWINLSGVIMSTIPFLMMYGRQQFKVTGSTTGTFLLFQMAGALITTTLLNFFYKKEQYRPLLYLFIIIASATPVLALILRASSALYMFVFLFTGASAELYKIVQPGILLEISDDENRSVYAGLSGAGALMNIVFPIAVGSVVRYIGYEGVFILTSLYILSGYFAARRIICSRFGR